MKTTLATLLLAFSFAGCYTQLAATRNDDEGVQRNDEVSPIIIVAPPPVVFSNYPSPAGYVAPATTPSGPTVRQFGSTRTESNRSQSDNGGRQSSRR